MDIDPLPGPFSALADLLTAALRRKDDARRALRVRAKLDRLLMELGVPAPSGREADLAQFEESLDEVLHALDIEWDPLASIPAAALEALREGRDIEAVYHYRKATGGSLREARRALDLARPRLADARLPSNRPGAGEDGRGAPPL